VRGSDVDDTEPSQYNATQQMIGGISAWYADRITAHSKLVIVAVLALTVLVAAGVAVGDTDERELGDFEVDSPETDAQDFVQENYGTDNTDPIFRTPPLNGRSIFPLAII